MIFSSVVLNYDVYCDIQTQKNELEEPGNHLRLFSSFVRIFSFCSIFVALASCVPSRRKPFNPIALLVALSLGVGEITRFIRPKPM